MNRPEENRISGFRGVIRELIGKDRDVMITGMYDEPFSRIYAELSEHYPGEREFYLRHLSRAGRDVLEIACGDGGRFLIPLTLEGYNVDGVDLSGDMLNICSERIRNIDRAEKAGLPRLFRQDIRNFVPDRKYDGVILPATSLCLLTDGEERNGQGLFEKIRGFLKDTGVFIFDYRSGPEGVGRSQPFSRIMDMDGQTVPVMYQEFWDGDLYVDFYTEYKGRKYAAASKKHIFSDMEVLKMLYAGGFIIEDRISYCSRNIRVDLLAAVIRRGA